MHQDEKNIPQVPQLKEHHENDHHRKNKHHATHKEHHSLESPVKDPVRSPVAKTFHEGHEKDIPDSKDFMDHNKFEQRKEDVDKHLHGECGQGTTSSTTTSSANTENNKGLWEKTKEAVSEGVNSIKNIITGKK